MTWRAGAVQQHVIPAPGAAISAIPRRAGGAPGIVRLMTTTQQLSAHNCDDDVMMTDNEHSTSFIHVDDHENCSVTTRVAPRRARRSHGVVRFMTRYDNY